MSRVPRKLIVALLAAILGLAGIGIGVGVAGAGSDEDAPSDESGESGAEPDGRDNHKFGPFDDEAFQGFDDCLRENGVDVPEPPSIDEFGDFGSEEFDALIENFGDFDFEVADDAWEACESELPEDFEMGFPMDFEMGFGCEEFAGHHQDNGDADDSGDSSATEDSVLVS